MSNRTIKLITKTTQIYWQIFSQYRLGAAIWIVNGMISPLILMYVWVIVSQASDLALNKNQIITYYLLTIVVFRLTQTWTAESLSNLIKEGRLSQYLIKPFSFVYERLASDLSHRTIRLISLSPFVLIAYFVFSDQITLTINPLNIILFITAIMLGYAISFLTEIIIGLLALYLTDAYGTILLYGLIKDIFSGSLIPLALMPLFIKQSTRYLLFYPQLGFPIDVIMGTIPVWEIITIHLISLIWVVILYQISKTVFRRGIKKYTSVGI